MLVKSLKIGCWQIFLLVIIHKPSLHLGSIQEETIKNTWKSVGHFFQGEFGDSLLEPASNTESVLVDVRDQYATAYNDYGDDDDDDDDDNIYNEEDYDGMEELEPLFCDGCRLRSNLLDMDDEDPLFVMELTS
jgi:hypothetical protein